MGKSIAVIFDLDDTLYKEIDFLKSAFSSIAYHISLEALDNENIIFEKMMFLYNSKQNVFKEILNIYNTTFTTDDLLKSYRNHKPKIRLSIEVLEILEVLKEREIPLGLLTDGRSVQQRNKIETLCLENYFTEIIISEEFGSEKPCVENYKYFENAFLAKKYFYIGDNIKKDFITPKTLNWSTIKLNDNGLNIHKNDEMNFEETYLAHHNINNFSEILSLLF